jgi:uncharacterized protein YciI
MLEKRTPFRAGHLKLAEDLKSKGVIVAGGAFVPPSGGMFIFNALNKQDVEDNFVKKDPYYTAGLITDYKIKEWTVVVGKL